MTFAEGAALTTGAVVYTESWPGGIGSKTDGVTLVATGDGHVDKNTAAPDSSLCEHGAQGSPTISLDGLGQVICWLCVFRYCHASKFTCPGAGKPGGKRIDNP